MEKGMVSPREARGVEVLPNGQIVNLELIDDAVLAFDPNPAATENQAGVDAAKFPAELRESLDFAEASGNRYMVGVWTVYPDGSVHLHRTRAGGFPFDKMLTALLLLRDQVLAEAVPK